MSNIKAELKIKLKAFGGAPKDEVSFAAARAHMRSIGGAPTLRAHLESEGLLAEDGLNLKVFGRVLTRPTALRGQGASEQRRIC